MRAGGLGGTRREKTAASPIAFVRFVGWSSHQAANACRWALSTLPMTNKYLFLDSFVFIRLAEDPRFAVEVRDYILANSYTLVIGVMNLTEVYKWKKYWEPVFDLISSVPFCIVDNPEKIATSEVSKYPNEIDLPTGFCSSESSFSEEDLKKAIEVNLHKKISAFEKNYRSYYRDVWKAILDDRKSFPAENGGKYSPFQQWLFLQTNVLKWLYPDHKKFLEQQIAQSKEIKIERFKSVYIQMLAIFLEYYVQQKEGKPSDVGDFYQLSILPYVDLAVLDNERYNLIGQINKQNLFSENLPAINLAQFRKVVQK